MTIKNLEVFVENLWDWGFLDGCFGGTRIRVTDIDGLVERNGHFLLIEAKSPGKEVPTGQRILFDRLVQDKRWHVLIVWGEPNKPQEMQVWGYGKMKGGEAKLQDVVRRWFDYAERQGKPVPMPQPKKEAA